MSLEEGFTQLYMRTSAAVRETLNSLGNPRFVDWIVLHTILMDIERGLWAELEAERETKRG